MKNLILSILQSIINLLKINKNNSSNTIWNSFKPFLTNRPPQINNKPSILCNISSILNHIFFFIRNLKFVIHNGFLSSIRNSKFVIFNGPTSSLNSPLSVLNSPFSPLNSLKAFTLIELLITITILSILGVVSFTSFNDYNKSARDSVRVSDINNITTSLDIAYVKNGIYPTPTNATGVVYSGSIVWYQGTVGEDVIRQLGNTITKPVDPIFNKEYTYSLLNTGREYQIGGVSEGGGVAQSIKNEELRIKNKNNGLYSMRVENGGSRIENGEIRVENGEIIYKNGELITKNGELRVEKLKEIKNDELEANNSSPGLNLLFPTVYSSSNENIQAIVKGNYNGTVAKTSNDKYIVALPSIMISDTTSDTELKNVGGYKLVYNGRNNIPSSYSSISGLTNSGGFIYETIKNDTTNNSTNAIIWSGTTLPTTQQEIQSFITNLKNAYSGTTISNDGKIKTIVSLNTNTGTTDTNQIVSLGTSIINNTLQGKIANITITYNNCSLSGTTILHNQSITAYSENSIVWNASYDCTNRQITRTCTNGVLDGSGTYQYSSCVKGTPNNCSANSSYIYNTHTYSIPALNHTQTGSNILSSTVNENNGLFKYTLSTITCNDGLLGSINENPTPTVQSCNTNYHISGNSCVADSQTATCGGSIPANATATTATTYTQTWNGSAWTPTTSWTYGAGSCGFSCSGGATWNGSDCMLNCTLTLTGGYYTKSTSINATITYTLYGGGGGGGGGAGGGGGSSAILINGGAVAVANGGNGASWDGNPYATIASSGSNGASVSGTTNISIGQQLQIYIGGGGGSGAPNGAGGSGGAGYYGGGAGGMSCSWCSSVGGAGGSTTGGANGSIANTINVAEGTLSGLGVGGAFGSDGSYYSHGPTIAATMTTPGMSSNWPSGSAGGAGGGDGGVPPAYGQSNISGGSYSPGGTGIGGAAGTTNPNGGSGAGGGGVGQRGGAIITYTAVSCSL